MSGRRDFIKGSGAALVAGVGAVATGTKLLAEDEPEVVTVEVDRDDAKGLLDDVYEFLDDIDLKYPGVGDIRCPHCDSWDEIHIGQISQDLDEKRLALRQKVLAAIMRRV